MTHGELTFHDCVTISDTGVGIPDNLLHDVFEPLFSTKGLGAGMGMPTVRQIMEQHGGSIETDSAEGKVEIKSSPIAA